MAEFEEKDLEMDAVSQAEAGEIREEAADTTQAEDTAAESADVTEDVEGEATANASDDAEEASEGEDAEEKEASDKEPAEKKGFFKKKDKKDKKDEQIEALTDQVKRTMAEFDNYRKRTDKEKSAMFEIGAKSVIEKMLPIVDNFERGLATLSEEEKSGGFAAGMEQVYKQLMNTLSEMGVEPIEAVGNAFDPNLHNAVMHMESDEYGENVIVQEFQKGYTYKGSVVRYSMVQVAN